MWGFDCLMGFGLGMEWMGWVKEILWVDGKEMLFYLERMQYSKTTFFKIIKVIRKIYIVLYAGGCIWVDERFGYSFIWST